MYMYYMYHTSYTSHSPSSQAQGASPGPWAGLLGMRFPSPEAAHFSLCPCAPGSGVAGGVGRGRSHTPPLAALRGLEQRT